MKNIAIALLLMPAIIHAQELKKVVQKDKKENTSEVYYVLKSNPTIKHGEYQKFYNDNIKVSGFYDNDKQDSLWIEYSWSGKTEAKGKYKQGQKIGVWEYYGYDGQIEQKYDYDKKEVIFNRAPNKEKQQFKLLIESATGDSITPPMYLEGDYAILKWLERNIRYPQYSRDNDIQGKVVIAFILDKDGKTSNHRIQYSIAQDLDAEALRVTQIIPDRWIPAKVNGVATVCEYFLPIVFKLQ